MPLRAGNAGNTRWKTICGRWGSGRRGTTVLRHALSALVSLRSLRGIVGMRLLSLVRWSFMVGMVYLSLLAYGIRLDVGLALLLFVVTSLAAALPSTPGFVGPLQAAFVFALVPFGIDRETAVAASVLFLVVSWLPVTGVGLALLLMRGMHVSDLRHELDESAAAAAEP